MAYPRIRAAIKIAARELREQGEAEA